MDAKLGLTPHGVFALPMGNRLSDIEAVCQGSALQVRAWHLSIGCSRIDSYVSLE